MADRSACVLSFDITLRDNCPAGSKVCGTGEMKMFKQRGGLIASIVFSVLILSSTHVRAQWTVSYRDDKRGDLNAVFFADQKNGWVIGDRGLILATHDAGSNWFTQNPRVTASLSDIFFRNREEGWIVAAGGRILHSSDGGDTWQMMFQLQAPAGAGSKDAP